MNIFLIIIFGLIGLVVLAVGIFIIMVFIEATKMEFKQVSGMDDKERYNK
jgi:hypothetical protein